MSMFDQLKGELGGIVGLASGSSGALLEHVTAMVNDPAHGGLQGLVQQFHQQGLGGLVNSWIGTGPNQPITAQQLQQVIGSERVQQLATKIGISPDQVMTGLTGLLPMIVDKLTPKGQLPGAPVAGR